MQRVDGPQLWVKGLRFGECPRQREDRLYLSDQHAGQVLSMPLPTLSGGLLEPSSMKVEAEVAQGPSGLGWLPDGTLLIVSMRDRKLLAQRNGQLVVHADLGHVATGHCNDMVVDTQGRAYVGNFGFDLDEDASPTPATLALVHPDGRVQAVADDLLFPNGMVLTPDGKTLIVAETFGLQLSAFDVAEDGTLSGRRVWASLQQPPDGICLDEAGHVWVAGPLAPGGFSLVAEGGEVLERVESEGGHIGIACMLVGPDRRTLVLCESQVFKRHETFVGNSQLRVQRVQVPGAGLP